MIKTVLMMGLAVLAAGCVDVTSTAGVDRKPRYTIECDGESGGRWTWPPPRVTPRQG